MAMTEVAQATVTIIPNMKGSQAKIAKDLGAETSAGGESAGKKFGASMVTAIKGVAAAAAIGKFIGDAINEGAKLQQSLGGIETLFKENADVVKGYASEAYKTAGISANEYMENVTSFSAALIKSMDGDTKAAADLANTAMIDMADNANKMGTDMASIQNAYQGFAKGNYTMLDNLKLGYGGTKQEMERLLADATELSGVEYNIDNLDDVYSAIHVIQEDLDITGTTAKEAASTFSGSFASMKAAATDLMGNLALGNDIGPQIQALAGTVKTFVVDNLLPMVSNVVQQIPTIIGELPGFLAEAIPDAIPVIADMVAGLAQGVVDNIPKFLQGIGQLLVAAWNAIMDIDWGAAGSWIVDVLGKAWDGLVEAAKGVWDLVVAVFKGEVEFPDLSGVAQAAWEGLTGVAQGIWDTITGIFGGDIEFPSPLALARSAWEGLKNVAQVIWSGITGIFTGDIEFPSLDDLAKAAWETLTNVASTIWEAVKGVFGASNISFKSIKEKAAEKWGEISGYAESLWTRIKGIFGASDITLEDLTSAAGKAWSGITTKAGEIWDGIKSTFSSFEIEWPDFGELASNALDGLKKAAQGVWDWIKGLFGGGNDEEAIKSVEGTTSEMVSTFADAKLKISEVDVSSITTANEHVKNTVISWIRIFDGVKLKMPTINTTALSSALSVVKAYVENYKQAMNFSWSLPGLHGSIPVISVNMREAASSDGKTRISYPDLSVSTQWFAKGAIFNEPTIIGIGDSKGPEAAVPLDEMWRHMHQEFKENGSGMEVTNYITVNGAEDPEQYAERFARELKLQLRTA